MEIQLPASYLKLGWILYGRRLSPAGAVKVPRVGTLTSDKRKMIDQVALRPSPAGYGRKTPELRIVRQNLYRGRKSARYQ